MSDVMIRSPMQYLDKATNALRDLGLMPEKTEDAPINALLQRISDLDQDRITVIARTLERPEASLAHLQRYYGPTYAERLYRES